tara:strand:- start:41 stop:547 length:507 start_codon:yes stop_codon:yes gene_type:complete
VNGLNDILSKQFEFLINEVNSFEEGWNKESLNFYTENEIINQDLVSLLYKIVENNYLIDTPWTHSNPMIYWQNKETYQSLYHNHYKTSTITCTTYINPLEKNEGGGIEFLFHQKQIITITPEPNYIYFFPSWALHRPLPQNIDKNRICINWGIESSKRPIHKLTGDRW